MHGNRTKLRQELEKHRLENERKRDEEEMKKRREMAGVQQSSSIDVPPPQSSYAPSSVEVPQTVLEVSVWLVHMCHCLNSLILSEIGLETLI